ncbi:MAG: formyltetrahydrofolate deformylase [bacterium]|nr:formyltetrahydrofolate deformylase [bacterium]
MQFHILRVDCPDATGLIHRITGVLLRSGLNIIANGEFVDPQDNRFFMRTAFCVPCSAGPSPGAVPPRLVEELRAEVPAAEHLDLWDQRPRDLVLLATTEPHCLGDLLLRCHSHDLPARIRAVISNRESLRDLVERFDVPFHFVPHQGRSRQQHEAEVVEVAASYAPDYLVLAKYMRILTADFVRRYRGRMINIHHSFLPAFAGARPYAQAFARGVKTIGATAHFVTDGLDEGPIIAQATLPIDHTHSAADMALAGRDVEKVVLARALQLVLDGRVFVAGNRTVIFD